MSIKYLAAVIILMAWGLLAVPKAQASEGIIELANINGSNAECFAMSSLSNRVATYRVLIQCQNLTYPAGQNGGYYILWAEPEIIAAPTPNAFNRNRESGPIRLGDLGFGRGLFTAPRTFTSLYVTLELTASPRTPSNVVIMEGTVVPITSFRNDYAPSLDEPAPTRIPTPTVTKAPTPTPRPQGGGGIISGIISFITISILIIIIIGIVLFVISRIRNR